MSDNRTAEHFKISKNVHPNTDGSPWGWIVLKNSPRVRVATWSGDEEYKYCQQLLEASQQTASLREELQRVYELVKKWHNQSDANEQCWKETVKDYNAQREVNKILREENEKLKSWKESMLKIWGPVIDWGQSKEAGLLPGTSISDEVLRRSRAYPTLNKYNDLLIEEKGELQEEVERLRELPNYIIGMREIKGRAGCTFGDTQYDSLSTAFGYQMCLEYIQALAHKTLSSKESKPS